MTAESKRKNGWVRLALFLLLVPAVMGAQIIPSVSPPGRLFVFGNVTFAQSDWKSDVIYGYTLGGFFQSGHIWGLETRGSLLRWGAGSAQESALFGPRAAMSFRRFTPYGAFLGGVGHSRWQSGLATSYNRSASGGEWQLLGGVDFHATRRLSFRLGEVSYSKIFLSPHGFSPTGYSAGIVYRLH